MANASERHARSVSLGTPSIQTLRDEWARHEIGRLHHAFERCTSRLPLGPRLKREWVALTRVLARVAYEEGIRGPAPLGGP